jgi:hypothetical protein
MDDDDYCVLEFTAESGRYYRYDGKGELSNKDIDTFDRDKKYENGYSNLKEKS